MNIDELAKELRDFQDKDLEAHDAILVRLNSLGSDLTNGTKSEKRALSFQSIVLTLIAIFGTVLGYFYVDDRSIARDASKVNQQHIIDVAKTQVLVVNTLKAFKEDVQDEHERYEATFEKLEPGKRRFDYWDHEEYHRQHPGDYYQKPPEIQGSAKNP